MVFIKEFAKWMAYRAPVISKLVAPSYPYGIDPAQLSFLCDAISKTRGQGSILEIGVARGNTSVFILEHLRTTGDPRNVFFLDTFSGFTDESIDYEVNVRSKPREYYSGFRYGHEAVFRRNLRRLGYGRFETVKCDASKIDYAGFAPISVVLLDIDLYLPTKAALNGIWPHMTTPGFICIDDCKDGMEWDGSLQAYLEFLNEQGLEPKFIGNKGGVIVKSSVCDPTIATLARFREARA